ncbi:U2 SNRNP protein [Cryptosporidium ubiquitum]|uniref:U2 SNRNP protein n=1 Tax=Cryptosporidium ubiquitum TaxID=857276 RepID=A0A1J4MFU7_9CRYT|nr:U2 SNRNP protein [Cryptosporidium ubiquitum]OII71908.1 U2 SNRNP protein [Cryptosporidium ubiquitum]
MVELTNVKETKEIDESEMEKRVEGLSEQMKNQQEYGIRNKKAEYKKLQNKLKKQRNKENRKRRRAGLEEENKQVVLNNKDMKEQLNQKEDRESTDEEVIYEIQENEELRKMFGEACKFLVGLDYQNTLEKDQSNDKSQNIQGERSKGKQEIESCEKVVENNNETDKNKRAEIIDSINNYEGVSMKLIMEEEEEEEEEREEKERKRRREFLQEMKNRNNGVVGKMTVKELKERTNHPELVEIWDTTAEDPEFLVYLKGCQGSVKIPQHWNSKRRYLQGKKGLERPPYQLPHFIEETKIAEIRALILEEESKMTMKQKQRRKIRPKLNRMDIDYQVLHDAFFIHSTKPHLTQFGDLYYEGKEFEFKFKNIRPGRLSQRLKDALGMQPNWPPPWLIRMQKYGPPPSYPYLRVPGVNSQIPNGCEFGFRPGEWGKPPLDDHGNPIWGLLPPIEDDDINYSKNPKITNNSKSNLYSSFDYWGEIEYNHFDDLEDSEDQDHDEHKEKQNHTSNIITNNTKNPNYTNSNNNDNVTICSSNLLTGGNNNNLYLVENPQDNKNSNQNNPSISVNTNPFLFNYNQISSNQDNKNKAGQQPLYTVLERKDLKMDDNSIFPSTYIYNHK